MISGISRSMVGEYAKVLSEAKADQREIAAGFRQEARLEAQAAITSMEIAEQARRRAAQLAVLQGTLAAAGGAAGAAKGDDPKPGSEVAEAKVEVSEPELSLEQGLDLAGSAARLAEQAEGASRDRWGPLPGALEARSNEAMALASRAEREATRLSTALATLGSSATGGGGP